MAPAFGSTIDDIFPIIKGQDMRINLALADWSGRMAFTRVEDP